MINKDNERLIVTLNKSDIQKLKIINTYFNNAYNLELTKSQVIKLLINNFNVNYNNTQNTPKKQPIKKDLNCNCQKSNLESKEQADILKNDYKTKLHQLKEKLNLTGKELSDLLNINFETLNCYIKGKRAPQGKNAEIINGAFKKYGIL